MNSREIFSILNEDRHVKNLNFLGVLPCDKIPKSALYNPCCAVVNTKPHDHKGEHWVSFLKLSNKRAVYFDSFGYPPFNLQEVGKVLDTVNVWSYNDKKLQTFYSTVCGQYCIFFLTHISRGYTLEHIIELLNDSGDTFANDAFIFNYIKNKYWNHNTKHLKIVDLPFIFNQAAYSYSKF